MPNSFGIAYMETCGHSVRFSTAPPKEGELLTCRTCGMTRRVAAVDNGIRVRCNECRFSRSFGNARITAEVAAAKHHRSHPSHTVEIKHDVKVWRHTSFTEAELKSLLENVLKVVTLRASADTLPIAVGDEPPF